MKPPEKDTIKIMGHKNIDKELNKAFIRGFACACSIACRVYEEGTAGLLLNEGGIKYADIKKAGADEYDLEPLRALKRKKYIK